MNARPRPLRVALCLGMAVALTRCTTTSGCRREPAPGTVAETSAVRHAEAVRSMACPAGLVAARRGGSDPDRYAAPAESKRLAMAKLVARLLAGGAAARPAAAAEAAAVGYTIEDVGEIPGAILLRELEGQRRGGGAYLFSLGGASHVVVQAVHTFFDEGTLALGCELFQRASARALFIDTAHRYKAAEADENGNHPADLAHARESLFQAATEGVLNAIPNATVVQLHGFASRESDTAVVLSSGVAHPGDALATRAQRALSAVVPAGRVQRFPDETQELGGTTNVQGALTRAAGASFLHVELAADLRKALLEDADLRVRFLDALAGSLGPP